MGIKTLVAVTSINNLSDARYCAGMGADILSFCLSEDQPDYVQPAAIKEIAGWVAGVTIGGQFYNESCEKINELIDTCGLQMVLLHSAYLLDEIADIAAPVILRVMINKDTDDTELRTLLRVYQHQVKYFLISSDDFNGLDETNIPFLTHLAAEFPVLLGFGINKDNIIPSLNLVNPMGVALQGGQEIKPGLKDYDELEEIFLLLEE